MRLFYLVVIGTMLAANVFPDRLSHAAAPTFTHGVASGDPDRNSVLLWTRLVSAKTPELELTWELSLDPTFVQILKTGTATTRQEHDFCVKVIADQLVPGTTYYYRFRQGSILSPIGRTQTLPREADHIRIGVANCAKYTGGYYHAYDALAGMDDLNVVIHLGDYIYENGATQPGDSYYPSFQATGRQHNPPHTCVSLQDYRTRYAQYRQDPELLKLHARYPIINIWDDHDIAKIPSRKLPSGEPVYDVAWKHRFNNSLQAWHEWIPSRVKPGEVIYRDFQLGSLVNLMMVDTRVCCKSDVPQTRESLKDLSRHIVGEKQLSWLMNSMLEHQATWNIMGNQLLFASKGSDWNRWPGFPADRNRLIDFLREHPQLNFLITTGNAHNPHHYVVREKGSSDILIHEVLPGSISSGNNTEKSRFKPGKLKKLIEAQENNADLLWYHNNAHGFIVIDLTPQRALIEWYFVTDIRQKQYQVYQAHKLLLNAK
ncbi:Alkaline phosphatase D precursor [Gimesia maris]|uniref:alkaline phosphatase D family protein n=1 Tax=Gimesia maris TaxID=122 RepID=UPI001189720C|nr:alkaline phosphatase D family protein [Gimesia maris]QDT78228.1 Alkaline phosphatase D precursor [Gimesia maris]